MKFGFFSDQTKEYIIERPDTPLPWMNYLGQGDFLALISNTASGYCFYKDARLRRLTRYRYNNPQETGSRFLYLRDDATGEFWSPTWQPVRKDLSGYTCKHGMGYSTISSTYLGIETAIRFFIPLDERLEIWDVQVMNPAGETRKLSLFGCVEFCLWDAWDDATNYQRNLNLAEVEVVDGVIYHKTEYRERRNHFAYFACSEATDGFETQREDFLGRYRGWDSPQGLVNDRLGGSIAHGWYPIGATQVRLKLKPGECKRIIYLLGYGENAQDEKFDPAGSNVLNKRSVRPVLKRLLDPAGVDAAFQSLGEYWSQLLEIQRVDTPNEHINRMVNIWNPYQCMVTFNLSRSASYFDTGIGRGVGFRDSNQDLLGFVHLVPERARERILDLAATQLESGGAYHQYQPLTKRGNDEIGGDFNDDPHWLVLSTAAYLKETGDWGILDEPVPFENRTGSEQPLYEHLRRCIQFTLDRLGPHGLPLIGRADWNDCLNLNTFSETPGETFQRVAIQEGTTAESVFIAGLFVLSAGEMVEIADRLEHEDDARAYREAIQRMHETTLEYARDGAWFLRAYDAKGEPIGSRECEQGRIFIEPQGMCVMAGIGLENDFARQALDSAHEYLGSQHGMVLHQPAYTAYDLGLGEISSYPPGYKENAGVFCHTNPWIMIAETMLGNAEKALEVYLAINPSVRESISEVHRCEPYIYAQMIAGKDAPTHGEAKNSWLTGTAAWNLVAISQWILGIRPMQDGLMIAPVIPDSWQGFTAQRTYRGVTYNISVERRGEGTSVQLSVNGEPIEGNVVMPPQTTQSSVAVHCLLG
jgi:cellobiose phosphorylase